MNSYINNNNLNLVGGGLNFYSILGICVSVFTIVGIILYHIYWVSDMIDPITNEKIEKKLSVPQIAGFVVCGIILILSFIYMFIHTSDNTKNVTDDDDDNK